MRTVHCFGNGIKVYDDQLIEAQRIRYSKCNVHEEDEEGLFVSIIQMLPADAIFVSIGSAIGYYALLAKKVRRDLAIHCFEPLKKHRVYFKENIALNGLSVDHFNIHDIAIAPSSAEYHLLDQAFGSFLVKHEDAQLKTTCPTKSIQLSAVDTLIGVHTIDLIQMDIQGLEAAILEGFFSAPDQTLEVDTFIIGTHGREIHARCRIILKSHNYELLHDESETLNQPDGILAAAKATRHYR